MNAPVSSPSPSPSPLADLHGLANAEIQAYDMLEIVSTFGEPQAEYAAIRKAAGLLDLPQRGVIELTGDDRHAFLNNLISNQVFDKTTKAGMAAGCWTYAFLLNLKGRVVADLNVIETSSATLLEMDARLVPMLANLFDRYLFAEKVKVRAAADLYEIAIHGAGEAAILIGEGLTGNLGVGEAREGRIIGVPFTAWRDDVCGVPGLHLILPRDRVVDIWQHLLTRYGGEISLGKRALRPIGWAAFNATRIEAGRPLFGIDFELAPPSMPGKKVETTDDAEPRPVGVLPAETSMLARAVSFTKGCYLGQEVVARMNARSQVARRLVGLRIDDDGLPIAGAHLLDEQQNIIGVVTSSTMSPILSDAAIALGIVRKPHFEPGTRLRVAAEGLVRGTTVTPLPFVKQENA